MSIRKLVAYMLMSLMATSICTISFNTFAPRTTYLDFKITHSIQSNSSNHFRSKCYRINQTKSPIRHLVVICQENHSFDNYFGTYPSVKGFYPLPGTPSVNGIPTGAFNVLNNGKRVYPFMFSPNEAKTLDTDHGYISEIKSWNGGKMNRFAAISMAHNAHAGLLSLGHYDYQTLPAYWDYAQHFSLADNWFQPIFGPTTPNVLYLFAAQAGTRQHPITDTIDPVGYAFTYPNIGDELSAKKVSWMWYQNGLLRGTRIQDNPLAYFQNYTLGKYRHHLRDLTFFQTDVQAAKLPAVTFIKADGMDEHPGQDIRVGMNFVVRTVNTIMKSSAWKDTAIIITYDECGGFWDHVPPKQITKGPDGLLGDGPRIPTIVISPYAKENYVSHVYYDTSSILRFIEWNWGLPSLNHRDASASNLLDFFQFQSPNHTRFLLPTLKTTTPTSSISVKLNNFLIASSGYHKPIVQSGHVWMNIEDFTRNLNTYMYQEGTKLCFQWQRYNVMIPPVGHYFSINRHIIRLKYPICLHYGRHTYLPIDELARYLGIQVKWVTHNEIHLMTTNHNAY